MTIWAPDLRPGDGPKYLAIADAIERDVQEDRLPPGSRLPPQRDLARQLGVTVGTVGRGYAEARRRGLLSGEVGRGTFVRGGAREAAPFGLAHGEDGDLINLAHNAPHFAAVGETLRQGLAGWPGQGELAGALGYQAHVGSERHRRAGAEWLRRVGLPVEADEVVVTAGAQHAMLIALSTLVEPGDLVLAEELAYPGMKALARFLRVRLEGVAMDEHGIVPDAFEECCRRRPAALYTTPTIQNPTATVLPEDRRRAIAEIAQRHAVAIVEDDTYGFLVDGPPPPLASFAGPRSFYLTSLSKSVAPGLRVGYLRCPAGSQEAVAGAMMTTTIMSSPLAAELATVLLENGTAADVTRARQREARKRQELARGILGAHVCAGVRPESAHLWLALPDPWRTEELAAQARSRGVAVSAAEVFAVGRAPAPHAVRVSLGAVADQAVLRRGLGVLAELLAGPPAPRFGGV